MEKLAFIGLYEWSIEKNELYYDYILEMGIVRHVYRELCKCNVYGPIKLIYLERGRY